jgi:hypothetical protein
MATARELARVLEDQERERQKAAKDAQEAKAKEASHMLSFERMLASLKETIVAASAHPAPRQAPVASWSPPPFPPQAEKEKPRVGGVTSVEAGKELARFFGDDYNAEMTVTELADKLCGEAKMEDIGNFIMKRNGGTVPRSRRDRTIKAAWLAMSI